MGKGTGIKDHTHTHTHYIMHKYILDIYINGVDFEVVDVIQCGGKTNYIFKCFILYLCIWCDGL